MRKGSDGLAGLVQPQLLKGTHGTVAPTMVPLSMLLEGIDWRHPARSFERPRLAL